MTPSTDFPFCNNVASWLKPQLPVEGTADSCLYSSPLSCSPHLFAEAWFQHRFSCLSASSIGVSYFHIVKAVVFVPNNINKLVNYQQLIILKLWWNWEIFHINLINCFSSGFDLDIVLYGKAPEQVIGSDLSPPHQGQHFLTFWTYERPKMDSSKTLKQGRLLQTFG